MRQTQLFALLLPDAVSQERHWHWQCHLQHKYRFNARTFQSMSCDMKEDNNNNIEFVVYSIPKMWR